MKQRESILIVAAEAAEREKVARRCLERGYATTAVSHPRQALAAASCHSFAAAIVDHKLPEINGLQLSKRLRGLVAGLKILLLSSDPDGPDPEELIEFGVDELLHLPCSLEQIGSKLDMMLGTRSIEKKPLVSGNRSSSISRGTTQQAIRSHAQKMVDSVGH